MRILVVDDDPMMSQLVVELLGGWSCESASAGSVDEALALLAAETFDLVLSDLQMPRRSGFDLLQVVRDTWPELPVVLFSSFPAAEMTKQAIDAGARGFLAKPFSGRALRAALESGVGRPLPS